MMLSTRSTVEMLIEGLCIARRLLPPDEWKRLLLSTLVHAAGAEGGMIVWVAASQLRGMEDKARLTGTMAVGVPLASDSRLAAVPLTALDGRPIATLVLHGPAACLDVAFDEWTDLSRFAAGALESTMPA